MSAAELAGQGRTGRQLAFEFDPRPRYGEEDFLVAPCNEAAHAMVTAWPAWPDPVAILTGEAGAGKSHLAAIWARRAKAVLAPPLAIRGDAELGDFYGRNVLVERADEVADERGLFHLFNLVQESRASMLLTATRPPEQWGVRLPDLQSRLRRAPSVRIEPPGDDLVRAVLVKLFVDRQLVVDLGVIDYIATRIDRSLGAARALVRALDEEALSQGRPIGRAMAASILARMEYDSEDDDNLP